MKWGFENGVEIVYVKRKGHRRSENISEGGLGRRRKASTSWMIL